VLLKTIARGDKNPKASALGTAATQGTIGKRHHHPGEQREVPRWHGPEAPRREVER
jgi:hypothetical protein